MHRPAIFPGLADQTVFITGGGSGIGAAITAGFAGQKAKVAFVDIAEKQSRATCSQVERETGRRPLFIPGDIRNIKTLLAAIEQTRKSLGDVGVLVNNAANDDRHTVEKVTVEYWDERMALNLRPMFFAAQAVLPQMKRLGGGSIINFGSISWMVTQGGFPAYATAKSAVHGLTRTLARDFGPFNIRVNCVVPGWTITERQLKSDRAVRNSPRPSTLLPRTSRHRPNPPPATTAGAPIHGAHRRRPRVSFGAALVARLRQEIKREDD